MVNIVICKKTNRIEAFTISGHSMYNDYGQDIVCAGISTLAQSCLIGLEHVAKVKIKSEVKDGFMSVQLLDSNEKAMALLETMELSMKAICDTYPENARIEYRRCDYVKD